MPCHPDYPNLTPIESVLTTIFLIEDELNNDLNEDHSYYHPKLRLKKYSQTDINRKIVTLCERLQKIKNSRNYSRRLQRWWLNHKIRDYKNIITANRQNTIKIADLSSYEKDLLLTDKLILGMMEDCFFQIEKQISWTKESIEIQLQKNHNRHKFMNIMSTFELFCELLFYKKKQSDNKKSMLFRNMESAEIIWKNIYGSSYVDWLNHDNYSDLNLYYEKYNKISHDKTKAQSYFGACPSNNKLGEQLIFTIKEIKNLIKILKLVISKLTTIES